MSKEEGDVEKSADSDGYHAPNASDGRRGAFTMVAECFGMACSMVHCLWNRVVHTHAHGHIISLEFQSHKKIPGDLLFICQSSSARESRTSHYASDRPKESWRCRWGCQR